jgi:butyrate kinase
MIHGLIKVFTKDELRKYVVQPGGLVPLSNGKQLSQQSSFQKGDEICRTVIKQAHPPVRRDRETAGVEGKVEAELVEGVQG